MHLVSLFYRRKNPFTIQDVGILDLQQWKYAKGLSLFLVLITVLIYVLLANVD
jgi:SSS family solute:Na+ symporter